MWYKQRGTVNELGIEVAKINKFAVQEKIVWNFNPPASPHMGGLWERTIRTVKSVMFSMIKNTVLTDFQLMTIFTEIENIVNNRPITHVNDDYDDLEALTPNHFLVGKYNMGSNNFGENVEADTSYRKRWKQV